MIPIKWIFVLCNWTLLSFCRGLFVVSVIDGMRPFYVLKRRVYVVLRMFYVVMRHLYVLQLTLYRGRLNNSKEIKRRSRCF